MDQDIDNARGWHEKCLLKIEKKEKTKPIGRPKFHSLTEDLCFLLDETRWYDTRKANSETRLFIGWMSCCISQMLWLSNGQRKLNEYWKTVRGWRGMILTFYPRQVLVQMAKAMNIKLKDEPILSMYQVERHITSRFWNKYVFVVLCCSVFLRVCGWAMWKETG